MRIEGITTCVGYSDILSYCLAMNRNVFDHLLVITSKEDRETQLVCDFWNIQAYKTDAFFDGGPFNKAKAINEGIKQLQCDGWVIHLDADIAMPPYSRRFLSTQTLDPTALYGADRLNCQSFNDWGEFLSAPTPQHELDIFVHPKPFPVGSRVAKHAYGGYIPIGFFQMWCPSQSGITYYPEGHTDAARSDMLFSIQWPRQRRHLIPELFLYHLESEAAPMGANWRGRTTKWFSPYPERHQPHNPRKPEPHPDTNPNNYQPGYGDPENPR